jgi:predicted phosphodiesterase
MKKNKTVKIACLSCTHSPFTPPATMDWVLSTLSNIKGLDFCGHLGDVFDSEAASVHPTDESNRTLEGEYEHARDLLASIRNVLPKKCSTWINKGNHDANIEARDPRRIPTRLRSLVHWDMHPEFSKEFRKWQWLPYEKSDRGVMNIGQCCFYHGFDAGLASDELEGLQMLNSMPHTQQQTFRLMVRGHTHRPVPPTQMQRTKNVPLPFWYANVGTCGPLKPNYMERKDTTQWGSAILVVECRPDHPSRLVGKCWDAELIRMPK